MPEPFMVYFGPYRESGHFFHSEDGISSSKHKYGDVPWTAGEIDGPMQPGQVMWRDHLVQRGPRVEGHSLLHHKDGWTAISMWDSSVDTRPGSSSTYIAKGTFTFEQMVELAKARFAERWGRMKFEVKLVNAAKTCPICKGHGGIPKDPEKRVYSECSQCGGKGYVS